MQIIDKYYFFLMLKNKTIEIHIKKFISLRQQIPPSSLTGLPPVFASGAGLQEAENITIMM